MMNTNIMRLRLAYLHLARFRLHLWLPLVLATLTLLGWPDAPAASAVTHTINLDAAQFAFEPGRLHVNQGDRVVFTLTASDVVHGFYLDGYGLNTRVEPGVAQQVEFVAERTGKFRYRCSVSCGPLHPFMIGELVVSPNTPFWKGAGVALMGMIGMLMYLWHSGKQRRDS